jgi:hypothetical protein
MRIKIDAQLKICTQDMEMQASEASTTSKIDTQIEVHLQRNEMQASKASITPQRNGSAPTKKCNAS